MNIDKFGHHVHKRLRLAELVDTLNDTLVKSESGDYDLKSSRLKGLVSPVKDDEAVNKAYVDKFSEELNDEINKVHKNVKQYLKELEKSTSTRLSTLCYTKEEIDNLIKTNLNKNE